MKVFITKAELSPFCGQLVVLMQQLNFGRIENLKIRNGEPILVPPTRILKLVRLDKITTPRPETEKADFILKKEVIELLQEINKVWNGSIKRVEIQYGLPAFIEEKEENDPNAWLVTKNR